MPTTVQIFDVPEDVRRTLEARAAIAGLSLSGYLLRQISVFAARPTPDEVMERLSALPPVVVSESSAEAVRAAREAR